MKDKLEIKEYIPKLVDFIKKEVTEAGKQGCVVGVSGGIDSAVIASLCKLAFPDTTIGISMPMMNNLDGDTSKRAKELTDKLNIPLYVNAIDEINGWTEKSRGNYYARQRMANLYLYAENINSLVVGTDNKSENYIGYFTKWGDSGVDINPIGQFFKSEVYELGGLLNVPESILNAKPTAELWEGQTDEDELGMTYDEMEEAIKIYENRYWDGTIELMKDVTEANFHIMKKVATMHLMSKHKRRTPRELYREMDD